jgi:ribosome-associated toxin RatA of RatAB toxin-antitoxin module
LKISPAAQVICGCVLLQALGAGAAADFSVVAEPRGSAVAIDARAPLTAPHAGIWSTLTDYGRLSEFIPGMHSSTVVQRRGPTAIVAQRGAAGFFIFSHDIDVIVASTEHAPGSIEIRLITGSLKQLEGRYQVERGDREGVWVLRWLGLIEPRLSLPQFLGVPLIRGNIEEQFRGMVDEIERRDAAGRATAAR